MENMKKIYLKPEASVEVMELEQNMMLSASDSPADSSTPLSREFDEEDFAQKIIFLDMLE